MTIVNNNTFSKKRRLLEAYVEVPKQQQQQDISNKSQMFTPKDHSLKIIEEMVPEKINETYKVDCATDTIDFEKYIRTNRNKLESLKTNSQTEFKMPSRVLYLFKVKLEIFEKWESKKRKALEKIYQKVDSLVGKEIKVLKLRVIKKERAKKDKKFKKLQKIKMATQTTIPTPITPKMILYKKIHETLKKPVKLPKPIMLNKQQIKLKELSSNIIKQIKPQPHHKQKEQQMHPKQQLKQPKHQQKQQLKQQQQLQKQHQIQKSQQIQKPQQVQNTLPIIETKIELNTNMNEKLIPIGPNGTLVSEKTLQLINWNHPTAATRRLLMSVFDRDTLAFHTLTGKPSPAFMGCNRPLKNQLNPKKVADIIYIVTRRSKAPERDIRSAITTKCADENKMFKQRQLRKEKLESMINKSNKENIN